MNLTRCVLKVDGQPITAGDVLAFARLNGWLSSYRALIRDRFACAALAEAEGTELSEEELQVRVDEWRGERDLQSAEETEAWFEKHGLDLDGLAEHLERKEMALAFAARNAEAQQALQNQPDAENEVDAQLPSEAQFEGSFEPLIERVAWLVAAPQEAQPQPLQAAMAEVLEAGGFANEAAFANAATVYGLNPARARKILEMAASFRLWKRAHATGEALSRELAARKQELRWYEIDAARFESLDVAREALCCVKDEGAPMAEIAARAEATCTRQRWHFDELSKQPAGTRIASAREGEVAGPQEIPGGGFEIYQVVARGEAELSDERIRARLEADITRRLLGGDVARRVQWR